MPKKQPQFDYSQSDAIKIKIPDTGGTLRVEDVKKETDSKFKDLNYILLSVVIILLIMVATLIIDSFHINSTIYKEYSSKNNNIEETQRINQQLLEENKKLLEQTENH